MSANKPEPPTKTIAFRWPSAVVDNIRDSAKKEGISMQDYFMKQISPSSELATFIAQKQQEMFLESQMVADTRDRMIEDAKNIMEQTGMSEDAFADAISQAFKILIKGGK